MAWEEGRGEGKMNSRFKKYIHGGFFGAYTSGEKEIYSFLYFIYIEYRLVSTIFIAQKLEIIPA